MSLPPPLPPYGRPPSSVPGTAPGGGRLNVGFVLQLVLGFLGTLAYGTLIFFLTLLTALSYGLPAIITELIFFGGSSLGAAVVLFLTFYFRWWGVLAGALMALSVPVLLFGMCMVLLSGTSVFGVVGI